MATAIWIGLEQTHSVQTGLCRREAELQPGELGERVVVELSLDSKLLPQLCGLTPRLPPLLLRATQPELKVGQLARRLCAPHPTYD